MNERQECLEFIDHLVKRTKLTGSALAKKAGLSPSTINRFINPKEGTQPINELSLKALNTLAVAGGYPSYGHYLCDKFRKIDPDHNFSFTTQANHSYGDEQPGGEEMVFKIAQLTADAMELASELAMSGAIRKEDVKRISVQAAGVARTLSNKTVTKNLILHLVEQER